MVTRFFSHPFFAPGLVIAAFLMGAALVVFLLVGPGLAPWSDALLTACFGWNAETRHYRLDSLIIVLLQPPLFAAVVSFLYGGELRDFFLGSRRGRAALIAPALFLAPSIYLLMTAAVSASGVPPNLASVAPPIRQATTAPSFTLVDHRSLQFTEETLKGRPSVLTFFYSSCHDSCPILIGRLKALEAREPGREIAWLAVTLDPERDTPQLLADYAKHWGLGERWHLLTGSPGDIQRFVNAYGIGSARLPGGEIAHENVVILIDRGGRLAFTYRGLAHPEERLAQHLSLLLAERG